MKKKNFKVKQLYKFKFPFWLWGKLPYSMMWEAIFFHKLRHYSDGITFFELVVNTDYYDDSKFINHNPQLIFRLIILNYTIFEINIHKYE